MATNPDRSSPKAEGARAPAPHDLVPGRIVGEKWRIVAPTRQSSFALAFEAREIGPEDPNGARRPDAPDGADRADRKVELQIFAPSLFETDAQARAFADSFSAWSKLPPGGLARVREAHVARGHGAFLVCDPPAGRPLRALLRERGRIGAAQTVRIGLDVLRGLAALHAAGQVHGDLKPDTIWVAGGDGDASDLAALAVDGGVTSALWSSKHLGERTALVGTPYYAPPEQFGGEAPDAQSDVYNLATVLFECATGVLPWAGRNMLEVFQAKLERGAPSAKRRAPEAHVPAELESAIVGGLMAEREKRYRGAREFAERLEALRLGR
jgi:serine/threonine-protein kinase